MPNTGQWEGDFDFRLRDPQGYVYLKAKEHRVALIDQHQSQSFQGDTPFEGYHRHNHYSDYKAHVYNIRWLGADTNAAFSTRILPNSTKLNYLLGKDARKWASGLSQYQEVVYHDLYPNIDLRYYLSPAGVCAFDFIVHPGGNPEAIQWRIEGVDDQGLSGGDIALLTSVGSAVYSAPYSYQEKQEVSSAFKKIEPGVYGFEVGSYKKDEKLVIDPILIFSTYSGSTDINFGFTATYGVGGTSYGGGIVFGYSAFHRAYPTTLGAFQDSSQGGRTDAAFTKYTADGSAQVYATYMGGTNNEIPFSLLEGPNKSLIILGATGSRNFPVDTSGFDTTFADGPRGSYDVGDFLPLPYSTDIFLSILDSTGGKLLGATFFGDSFSDGVNENLSYNYGDNGRGDITLDSNGNIIVTSYTQSPNLPTGMAQNSSYGGLQDGLVLSFSPDLKNLNWARYLGGERDDAAISLRTTPDGRLFVTGITRSDSIPHDTQNVYQSQRKNGTDAFITELNPQNGDVLKWTFSGTSANDRSYFIDYTPQGNLVILGQTNGQWPWIGDSLWGIPNSTVFLQEFSPDLSRVIRSTSFGNGDLTRVELSPTALMISDCGDVFVSGWSAPYGPQMGTPLGLPVTYDAILPAPQDSGEFYFMRLSASWKKLEYATLFGDQNAWDHVDGGSSRFRKDGSIFQAICACGPTFPTTANAYSSTRGLLGCNMVILRFDMEADTIISRVSLADGYSETTCVPGNVKFKDDSFNADLSLVIDPRGNVDTLRNQIYTVQDTGLNTYRFLSLDTNCNLVDSSFVAIYGYTQDLEVDFRLDYDSCDGSGAVRFTNLSRGATSYNWSFGDSARSNDENPTHSYLPGTYEVRLIVNDSICGFSDTLESQVTVVFRSSRLDMLVEQQACDPERLIRAKVDLSRVDPWDYQVFEWYVEDQLQSVGDSLSFQASAGGFYHLKLIARDTICNRQQEFRDTLYFYDKKIDPQFPNVFTPNGDGVNDQFGLVNLDEVAPLLSKASLEIYNRNGTQLYLGDVKSLQWNGENAAEELPVGVYYYLFKYEDICGTVKEQKGFLHLQR